MKFNLSKIWKNVRAHFRASLATSEYENTSNLFHVTAAEQTQELLQRCDQLLASYADDQAATTAAAATAPTTSARDATATAASIKSNGCSEVGAETGCYLEMMSSTSTAATAAAAATAAPAAAISTPIAASKTSLSASREYIDLSSSQSLNSDKTFRCSSNQHLELEQHPHSQHSQHSQHPQQHQQQQEQQQQDQQIYDICQNPGEEETQQVFAHELFINCPYADLPAGHLALHRSIKFGQLQRIEKRLFFDQTKKYYCGILNDWMLCYADGPTSCRPSSSLYLKSSAIEIEHFGEGKRREVCFQITTADPSKKFVYQANNEVDAKEWIHAIEAAIRGEAVAQATLKSLRKLPTPPVMKRLNFAASTTTAATNSDSIYEEPSPIYNFGEALTPPRLPEKCNSPSALAKRFEYDIPKCPPQPLVMDEEPAGGEVETAELLNGGAIASGSGAGAAVELKAQPQPSSLHGNLALDFQAKVKTVHSELSSQLTSPERLKKAVKKSYSCGNPNSEPELLSLTSGSSNCSSCSPATLKDQKKQRKATQTPPTSPQKTPGKDCDKLARNWFLSRLNKTSSTQNSRSTGGGTSSPTSIPANAKCKLSEKENLLNGLDMCDGSYDGAPNDLQQYQQQQHQQHQQSSNPTSPCLKAEAKSKVNMIINQFESSGHLSTMFSVEALAANALASLTSFCESDNCNNYEPIMPLATPPSSYLKKV
ncbi:uncharacterized protein LOC6579332 isoform X2 [Drosophila mojavensis]|uniref:Uncharacterized protein, isoform B n=1 Tax=Drosophila mojavensis TaxID=7230 RepID=A0A0Q9X7Y9_DROMO|nr:uncharacterized protein LOC6579332 isoform X2 [Drosophila mojavensis]KRG04479.1 uncharacterized protein Dmoj_GI19201, isoform B [Drosophila mojavensis]